MSLEIDIELGLRACDLTIIGQRLNNTSNLPFQLQSSKTNMHPSSSSHQYGWCTWSLASVPDLQMAQDSCEPLSRPIQVSPFDTNAAISATSSVPNACVVLRRSENATMRKAASLL